MYADKKILALIPARGGSKGVPGKNLRLVAGVSLLARTIASAQASAYIDKIVVSSDDQAIIAAALQAGAAVPFVRPAHLATDEAPAHVAILHALENLPGYDYVIVLQVTSPLRTTADIDQSIEFCLLQSAPACVSVTPTDVSPYWMFQMNAAHALTPVLRGDMPLRRQDLPTSYVLNGAIYIAACAWYMLHKTFLTAATLGFVMTPANSLDIDTEFDFQLLQLYLQNNVMLSEPVC